MDNLINGATSKAIKITTGYATNANITKMKVLLRNKNNSATILPSEITTIKPQITKGTQKNIFGMGCITKKIVNKNLWNKNNIAIVWGKGYNSSGEWVSYSGADWGGNNYKDIPLNENTAYILSGKLVSSGYTSRFHYFDINGNFISAENKVNTGGVDVYTFTTPAKARYLSIQAYKPYYNTDTIQLEQGSTASPYIAHQEQTFIIPVQQPMRSIGDVRDFFFKNVQGSEYYDSTLTENAWYERHNIVHIVINGTETITIFSSTSTRTVFQVVTNLLFYAIKQNEESGRCTHFIPVWQGATWKYGDISTRADTAGIAKSLFPTMQSGMTIEEFKTWSSNNNVETDMILVNPTNLPCTEEQTQVLEALLKAKSYEDKTIIYSEDITPAYLNAEALKG